MSKAGRVLKQVLQQQGVSQYALAKQLGIGRANISHWVNETRDITSDRVVDLVLALKAINPAAAQALLLRKAYATVHHYLGELATDIEAIDPFPKGDQ